MSIFLHCMSYLRQKGWTSSELGHPLTSSSCPNQTAPFSPDSFPLRPGRWTAQTGHQEKVAGRLAKRVGRLGGNVSAAPSELQQEVMSTRKRVSLSLLNRKALQLKHPPSPSVWPG